MFIGRARELALLREKNWRDRAEMIVVYGRRRIGKTALIEKAYEQEVIWKFEGIEGGGTAKQIKHFIFTLYNYTQDSRLYDRKPIKTWEEALLLLDQALKDRTIIVFFDEFQWMASMRKALVSAFKWAWDNYFSKHPGSRFILCGSVSSFIVKKVLSSNALYGRVDLEMSLKPFTIQEINTFFNYARTKDEVLEIAMIFGGIPQYLSELDPKKSIAQNLEKLAFTPQGYFFNEYKRLFISHFSKNVQYEKILKLLSRTYTLGTDEIVRRLELKKSGGSFTNLVGDLELAGFIERFHPLDKNEKSKLIKIRIHDEFLQFYFHFVEKNRQAIEEGTLKAYELLTGALFEQWRGYAFERIVRKNAHAVAKALGFSGIQYTSGSWFMSDRITKAQIDLLFMRKDNVLTVGEMKYSTKIPGNLIENFEKKCTVLKSYYSMPIQKILILGKRIPIPEKVGSYFDAILFAEDIFF